VDTTALPEEALMPPRKKPSLAELRPANRNHRSRWRKREDSMPKNYVVPASIADEHDPEGRGGRIRPNSSRSRRFDRNTGQFGIAVARATLPKADDHALRSLSGQGSKGG